VNWVRLNKEKKMKKLVIGAAALACASIVSAQTVTSANIVGYNKDVSAAGSFHISALQFTVDNPTPEAVYGTSLPVGSKIYAWNGAGYLISTFAENVDWSTWPPTTNYTWIGDSITFENSDGYWVENAGASEATTIIAGDVPMSAIVTNGLVVGFQLISYPFPVARNVADLELNPTVDDKVYAWNGSGYDIATYAEDIDWSTWPPTTNTVWLGDTVNLAVGEGFWYETSTARDWVVNRPFTTN
jgi:hypothetical protein